MGIKITRPQVQPSILEDAQSASATPDVMPLDAPPSPKTSPSPRLGMIVLYRTMQTAKQFNDVTDHVAIITRVWPACVNLKVFPDCGEPYDATSQKRIAYQEVNGTGWFTIEEAQG